MSTYLYFIPENYGEFIDTCKKLLNHIEPGTIIAPPKSGIVQRIEQLIQDHSQEFDLPLVHIRISPSCEDIHAVEKELSGKNLALGKSKMYLLISNCSYALKSRNTAILDTLVKIQYKTRTMRTIFFFESNIFSKENTKLFNQTHLYTHVYYYPLLSKKDAEKFIYYSADEWKMKKPARSGVKKMIKLTGGNMWLIRHVLREYGENPDLNFSKLINLPSTQFRLSQIAESLSEDEQRVLTGEKPADSTTVHYLEQLDLLRNNTCTIPLLYDFLIRNDTASVELRFSKGTVFAGNVQVTDIFSPQELRLIKLLIKEKNKPVVRDDIADALWENESHEKYSEWAIEQIVKRVREKLAKLGIGKTAIKSVRGKGCVFNDQ